MRASPNHDLLSVRYTLANEFRRAARTVGGGVSPEGRRGGFRSIHRIAFVDVEVRFAHVNIYYTRALANWPVRSSVNRSDKKYVL